MNKQEKKDVTATSEEETTEEETTDETENTEGEESSEEETPTEDDSIDYKAELEKTQNELAQAQFLLKKKNIDDKKKKEDAEEPEFYAEEEASESVDEKLENFKLAQLSETISEELTASTNNTDEQALIDYHFKNSIKRTGDTREAIRRDIKTARMLANQKRFEKLDAEIIAKKKSNPSNGGGAGGEAIEDDVTSNDEGYSAADRALLKRYGVGQKK